MSVESIKKAQAARRGKPRSIQVMANYREEVRRLKKANDSLRDALRRVQTCRNDYYGVDLDKALEGLDAVIQAALKATEPK